MHWNNDKLASHLLPATLCVGFIVLVLTASAIAALSHGTHRVGDIVSFTPMPNQSAEGATRLIAHRLDNVRCVLDLGVLRQSGGSLVVESQIDEAGDSFRVHWAGQHTSSDAGNCGDNANLILDGRELDILAMDAGGYGVGQKRMPVIISETGV